MAEIWVSGAFALGGAVISGAAKSKQADKDRAANAADRKAATRDEALYGGILSKFEADQEYYYGQKRRQNTERGLDQVRAFNTVGNPNTNRIVVPEQPDINTYLPEVIVKGGDQKKKRGLFDKITDPAGLLGGKASKIADPLGLFG